MPALRLCRSSWILFALAVYLGAESGCGSGSSSSRPRGRPPAGDETVSFELEVVVEGNGAVSPASGSFPRGERVELTATPDEGWRFDGWSGDASGGEPRIRVVMDRDRSVVARFLPEDDVPGPGELLMVESVSPEPGEEGVAVFRPIVVRFSGRIDPASIGSSLPPVRLLAAGEEIDAELRVAEGARGIIARPLPALPAATRVRILIDTTVLRSAAGTVVDGDGDGEPGGIFQFDFRTVALARVPGTDVRGRVLDSYTHLPLSGVAIHVPGLPEEASAATDAAGEFLLRDMPAPEFFVVVDGSTTTNAAPGFSYPTLGKPFHSVPGEESRLEMNGVPFDIHLPPFAFGDLQEVSGFSGGGFGFGPNGTRVLEEMFPELDPVTWSAMRVAVAPGAARDRAGNVVGDTQAVVIPVPPDSLPAPLPANLEASLVVSVQLRGADVFDVPAEVTFPNFEDLPEGEEVVIVSFDHDAGRWTPVGTATVMRDAVSGDLVVRSDPGSGLRAPGWHLFERLWELIVDTLRPDECVLQNLGAPLRKALRALAQASNLSITVVDLLTIGKLRIGLRIAKALSQIGGALLDDDPSGALDAAITRELMLEVVREYVGVTGEPVSIARGLAAAISDSSRLVVAGSELYDAYTDLRDSLDGLDEAVERCLEAQRDARQRIEELGRPDPGVGAAEDDNGIADPSRDNPFPPYKRATDRTPSAAENALGDDPSSRDRLRGDLDALGELLGVLRRPSIRPEASVDVSTADGSAAAGEDYVPSAETLAFREGERSRTFSVEILGGSEAEAHEEFRVRLSNPRGGVIVVDEARALVLDDDGAGSAPALLITDAVTSADEDGVPFLLFTVTRHGELGGASTVDYRTEDGTARAGVHYAAAEGSLQFAPGETRRFVIVRLLGGAPVEAAASFSVVLEDARGAEVADPRGLGVLVASAETDVFLLTDAVAVESEGSSSLRIEVRREQPEVSSGRLFRLLDSVATAAAAAEPLLRTLSEPGQGMFERAPGTFYSIERMPDAGEGGGAGELLRGALVGRGRAGVGGKFRTQLAAETDYQVFLFDAVSGLSWRQVVHSGRSGRSATQRLFVLDDEDLDSDLDGLSDVAEAAVGTDPSSPDTDRDGISDLDEIDLGLDPLGGRGFGTGVIAALDLRGTAERVVVENAGTPEQPREVAYVASGRRGLAIVDVSRFHAPVLEGEIDLAGPGDAVDVSVDPRLGLAAVAAEESGLFVVDVSDPVSPRVRSAIGSAAGAVEVFDGAAYVASAGEVRAYDLETLAAIDTLAVSSRPITDLTRDGRFLYSMDAEGELTVLDISGRVLVRRGTLAVLHGGGRIFAGGGFVYAGAIRRYNRGGFSTIDVSDPDAPSICSESDVLAPRVAPGVMVAANGSGRGVLVGSPSNVAGDFLEVIDLSDCANTDASLPLGQGGILFPELRVELAGRVTDAVIASGFAVVADGDAGLKVVNFLPFDVGGAAPRLERLEVADAEPEQPGTQVERGSRVFLRADVVDDSQVRAVEVRIDGRVVSCDVTYPFELFFVAAAADPNARRIDVIVRAVDTAGNRAETLLALDVVGDFEPPSIVSVDPRDGALRGDELTRAHLRFSEDLAGDMAAASFVVVGGTGAERRAQTASLDANARDVSLTFEPLPAGEYELVVLAGAVRDLAGNSVPAEDLVASRFTLVRPTRRWTGAESSSWSNAGNWSGGVLPAPGDIVVIDLAGRSTVQLRSTTVVVRSVIAAEPLRIETGGRLTVRETAYFGDELEVSAGTLAAEGVVNVDGRLVWSGGTLTGSGAIVSRGELLIRDSGIRFLECRLRNEGRGRWTGGRIANNGRAALFTNAAAGFLDLGNGERYDRNVDSGALPEFENLGVLRKLESTLTTRFEGEFHNRGRVEVLSGGIDLERGGRSSGVFSVSEGATLSLSGTHTFEDSASIDGDGVLVLNSGTLDVETGPRAGSIAIAGGTLAIRADSGMHDVILSFGELRAHATVTVEGTLTWTGGRVGGSGRVRAAGPLAIETGPIRFLSAPLEVAGEGRWNDGEVIIDSGRAGLATLEGGELSIAAGRRLRRRSAETAPTVHNLGTLRVGARDGGVDLAGTLLNEGTLTLAGGLLLESFVQRSAAAVTTLDDGVLSASLSVLQAGRLDGDGLLNGDVVSVAATLSPGRGGSGRIGIIGDYAQGPGAVLAVAANPVGAGGAGGDAEAVVVLGRAALEGFLDLTLPAAPVPAAGDSYAVLSAREFESVGVDLRVAGLPVGLTLVLERSASAGGEALIGRVVSP
jgi:phage baseplate assembly protein gpV